MYKNSKDPFISNLYYSFLRIAFIGRVVYDVKDIILTGTILNCLFFAISFIFIYKLLKIIFKENKSVVLFGMLCISLVPSSVSFAMFLRPYQMQETFFIVFTYMVFYILSKKDYSIKNFILLTFITGVGYLTLTSAILFVLCISLSIFVYYIVHENVYIEKFIDSNFSMFNRFYLRYYAIVSIVSILFLFVLTFLGMKTRYGYLKLENFDDKTKVVSKIEYKSSIFRHSDIYIVNDVKVNSDGEKYKFLKLDFDDVARINIIITNDFDYNDLKNVQVSYRLSPKMYKILPIIIAILLAPILIYFILIGIRVLLNNKNIKALFNIKLIYFASSFILAFLVSHIFYSNFFNAFLISNSRAVNSLKIEFDFLDYINTYGFAGFLIPIFILSFLFFKFEKSVKLNFSTDKYLIPLLIIFSAMLWSFVTSVLSPFKLQRYSIGSYSLVLIILPLTVTLLGSKKLQYIFMVVVSCLYIQNIFTAKNLAYVEIDSSDKKFYIFKQKPELPVYGVNTFLSPFIVYALDNSQEYILVKDYKNLKEKIEIDKPNNFYLILENIPEVKNIEIDHYTVIKSSVVDKYSNYNVLEFSKN